VLTCKKAMVVVQVYPIHGLLLRNKHFNMPSSRLTLMVSREARRTTFACNRLPANPGPSQSHWKSTMAGIAPCVWNNVLSQLKKSSHVATHSHDQFGIRKSDLLVRREGPRWRSCSTYQSKFSAKVPFHSPRVGTSPVAWTKYSITPANAASLSDTCVSSLLE
jgi:hypothetical protein